MPVVKGKHYPYTAAGKSAAARARKGMNRGGQPRRSDPERRESVRKRAAAAAESPLLKAARGGARTVRGPNSARMINMLEGRVSPRTTAVHEYAGPAGRLPPHGALKYAKGGAVRGPNS